MKKCKGFVKIFIIILLSLISVLIFYIYNEMKNYTSQCTDYIDYTEIDYAIISKINNYNNHNSDRLILSIYINHSYNKGPIVYCSISSDNKINFIYESLLEMINNDNLRDIKNFYANYETISWKCIMNQTVQFADTIYNESGISSETYSVQVSIISNKDHETILFTVDNKGNIIYDILYEQFKSKNMGRE